MRLIDADLLIHYLEEQHKINCKKKNYDANIGIEQAQEIIAVMFTQYDKENILKTLRQKHDHYLSRLQIPKEERFFVLEDKDRTLARVYGEIIELIENEDGCKKHGKQI